jgi:hypothetical protein
MILNIGNSVAVNSYIREGKLFFFTKIATFSTMFCTKYIHFTLHSAAACHSHPNFVDPMRSSVMQYKIVETLSNILAIYYLPLHLALQSSGLVYNSVATDKNIGNPIGGKLPAHCISNEKGEVWVRKTILHLWDLRHEMWEHRNSVLHNM